MKIDHLILGAYETNSYVLRQNDVARDCLIIDTGLDAGGLIDLLTKRQLNPVAIVFTHGNAGNMGFISHNPETGKADNVVPD